MAGTAPSPLPIAQRIGLVVGARSFCTPTAPKTTERVHLPAEFKQVPVQIGKRRLVQGDCAILRVPSLTLGNRLRRFEIMKTGAKALGGRPSEFSLRKAAVLDHHRC